MFGTDFLRYDLFHLVKPRLCASCAQGDPRYQTPKAETLLALMYRGTHLRMCVWIHTVFEVVPHKRHMDAGAEMAQLGTGVLAEADT